MESRSIEPRTLRDGSSDDIVQELAPEIIVVVAYGCVVPPQIVVIAAKYGCINLHVSLLPKYRGSAPIQWAVLNGDSGTGVSIMQLDEGLDAGDVLMVEPVDIDPEELRAVSCLTASALSVPRKHWSRRWKRSPPAS